MNTKGHAVRWGSQTFYLSDLTVQVKDDFCAWLVRREISNAFKMLEANQALRTKRMILANPPTWTSLPDEDVAAVLNTEAGALQLNRLLFALSDEELNDAELRQLILEKDSQPGSDYQIAMGLIQENADPKAKAAGSTSPAAKDASGSTQPSDASRSTETESSMVI